MCGTDVFLAFIAILFPPIAVWVKRGLCSADSLINLALCCLGVLPGLLHAWYIIYLHPDPTYSEPSQDAEGGQNGRVTYYYVQQGPPAPHHSRSGRQGGQQGYGTVGASAPASQFPGQQAGAQPYAPQAKQQVQRTEQAAGSSSEVPPSYQEAVSGDHKVQSRD